MRVRRDDDETMNCGTGGGADDFLGLRIASIFIILIGSLAGTLFPIVARHSTMVKIPKVLFEYVALCMKGINVHVFFNPSFAKYFGSGVIVRSSSGSNQNIKCNIRLDCYRLHTSTLTRYGCTQFPLPASFMASLCMSFPMS